MGSMRVNRILHSVSVVPLALIWVNAAISALSLYDPDVALDRARRINSIGLITNKVCSDATSFAICGIARGLRGLDMCSRCRKEFAL